MIIILLALAFSYYMHAADPLNNDALFLRLLQESSLASHQDHANTSANQGIMQQIKDKQDEIDSQWQECCYQAATVEAAGILFGAILYPPILQTSIPYSLLLGAGSSAPYCGVLCCIHSYNYAKSKNELDDLIREYQQAPPALRAMEE